MTERRPMGLAARIEWLDYAKGIGIILVVLGHVIRGLRDDMVGPRLDDYQLLDPIIYSFHMPLFFFVSGMIFVRRLSHPVRRFSYAVAIGIMVPYGLWTVAFVGLQHVAISDVNNPFDVGSLSDIWAHPIGHMWFLYALFFVEVVFYTVWRLFRVTGLLILTDVLVVLYMVPALRAWSNDYVADGAMGGTFFALGLWAMAWKSYPKSSVQAVIVFIASAALWMATLLLPDSNFSHLLLAPFAAAFGVSMTVAVCRLLPHVQGPSTTLLAQLGQASIAIFVAHVIFAAGLRILLYRIGVFDCDLHVFAGTLVGLAAPLALFILANWLAASPYIGFGRTQEFLYAPVLKAAR